MKNFVRCCFVLIFSVGFFAANAEIMYDPGDYATSGSFKAGGSGRYTLNSEGRLVLSLSITKGSQYTFVSAADGAASEAVSLSIAYIYREDGDTWDSDLSWSGSDRYAELQERMLVSHDDWVASGLIKGEDYDPEIDTIYTASAYYLVCEGVPGTSFSISSMSGLVEESIPQGYEDNPIPLGTIGTATVSKQATITDESDCWFSGKLTEGECYEFTASGSFTEIQCGSGSGISVEPDFFSILNDDGSKSLYVMPRQGGNHLVKIVGHITNVFTLAYHKFPVRPLAEHPISAELLDGIAIPVEAGARNDTDGKYYDEIIDTSLYSVNLKAGEIAHFETSFMIPEDYVLEVYDATGKRVARNLAKSAYEIGCAMSYVPEKGGTYYVGVAQRELNKILDPDAGVISGEIVYTNLGAARADPDDKPLTGNALKFVLGDEHTEGALQLYEDGSPHGFDAFNTVDWYILGARRGITYNLKATGGAGYLALRPMNLSVYTVNAKGVATLVADLGNPEAGVDFTAPANQTYYVKASLPDGAGCDYPYELYAWVDGTEYGFLQVFLKGAVNATWNLSTETSVKYNSGAEIMLKAGEYTVQAGAATGWSKPGTQKVTVVAGNDNRQVLTFKYSDLSDPKDDVMSGAVAVSPSYARPVELSRSLWTDDPMDFFKLQVKLGTVYDLSVESSEGFATMTVYRNGKLVNGEFSGEEVAAGQDIRLYGLEGANYYVVVTRAEGFEDVDAAYTLMAKSTNIGIIKTDKTEYAAKEKSGLVTIKLTRSGKEGKVRVRYTTLAGSALPGKDYEAQNGILVFEHGESSKTISVKVIPDLIDAWGENRSFSVVFDAVDIGDYSETEEYYPLMEYDEVTVSVTDSSKAAPGSVQFAETKLSVNAGDDAVLTLSRVGGADQMIGVVATVTSKSRIGEIVDTASQEIWWADGDAEDKVLNIMTMRPTAEYFADQTFTVKLTSALNAEAKAGVSKNATATVTVTDDTRVRTIEDYAASYDKASGVTVKASAKDTWYFDQSGSLRSITPKTGKVELTFTVTGPGHLAFSPEVISSGEGYVLSCMIGKESVDVFAETYIERYLGSGTTVVKLTLTQSAPAQDECYVILAPQQDGMPFLWEPLESPKLIAPRFGVNQIQASNNVHLEWSESENPYVRYRIFIDKNAKLMGTADAMISSLSGSEASALVYPYMEGGLYCPGCDGTVFDSNSTYSWRIDSVMLDESDNVRLVNTNKVVWTFKTAADDAPEACVPGGTDAEGNDIAEQVTLYGQPLRFRQGVMAEISLGGAQPGDGRSFAVITGSKLPDGMKLDPVTGVIKGVPTKVGTYNVAVMMKKGAVPGVALAFDVEVTSIGLAVGSFNGLLNCYSTEIVDDPTMSKMAIGSIVFTSTDTGKLTAKLNVGGASYSFSGTGWNAFNLSTNESENTVSAVLRNLVTLNRVVYTNELSVVVSAAAIDDLSSVGRPLEAELALALPSADKLSVFDGALYSGVAYRDIAKRTDILADAKRFSGYYTVAFSQASASSGAPNGNGYLTLTVDEKGKAKFSGVLADGAKLSGTASVGFVPGNDPLSWRDASLFVPVFYAKGTESFGGWLQLAFAEAQVAAFDGQDIRSGEAVPVITSNDYFYWYETGLNAWDGWNFVGFSEELIPVGGYYSKLVNLQAYYNGYRLFLQDFADDDQLPYALADQLKDDYEITAYAGKLFNPESTDSAGLYLSTLVNAITADKTVLGYRYDEKGKKTKMIDWAGSVNPCKFTFKFAQATGIFTGSMDMYAGTYGEDGVDSVQTKLGTFSHQGVLLMSREAGSPIDDHDGVMTGFYQAPASFVDSNTLKKGSIKLSYRLDIGAEAVEAVEEKLPRE